MIEGDIWTVLMDFMTPYKNNFLRQRPVKPSWMVGKYICMQSTLDEKNEEEKSKPDVNRCSDDYEVFITLKSMEAKRIF